MHRQFRSIMHINEHTDDNAELHDINLTPLIDVMMVLLIIFMVAAPLATVNIQIDLPVSEATTASSAEQAVFLTATAHHQLYLNEQRIEHAMLTDALDKATQKNKDTLIFFRADKTLDYQTLMEIMDNLRRSGYHKVGLVGLRNVDGE